jgi:DNA invertase Pin-like site-specific DNA recombinase
MAIIGYARVSTKEQNLDLQLDALKKASCEEIYFEKISGTKDRPELDNALTYLRQGDTLVIWKLDRLGRSLRDLVNIVDRLYKRGVEFRSIQDGIDTKTPLGRYQFALFAALAEYEREMIVERTRAGLTAAKERGRVGGRKKGLSPEVKKVAKAAATLYKKNENTVKEICDILNISKPTLYRYLKSENVESNKR